MDNADKIAPGLLAALDHGFTGEQYQAAKRIEHQIFGPYQWQNQRDRASSMTVAICQALREAEARGKAAGLRDAAGELCRFCHLGHKPEERSDAWGWMHKHDDAMGPMPCKASSLLDRAAEIEAEDGDG
jgi:hypothetical protein